MALNWIRLDVGIASNPKIVELLARKHDRAVVLFVFGLAHCGQHSTGGFVASSVLPAFQATPRHAQQLVDVELWDKANGGWTVRNWSEYQIDSTTAAQRSERARHAAQVRWGMTDDDTRT